MPSDCSSTLSDRRVLIVVAHPDDAEAFCGGTIAKLTRAGNHVVLVICTNGERGSHDTGVCPSVLAEVRRREEEQARQILGIQEVVWLGYQDGSLADQRELRDRLIRAMRQLRPDIVMTFDPWKHYEFHPDHRAVGFATAEARILADLPWVCPECTMEGLAPWHPTELYLFAPQEPNYWVDISDTIDYKIQSRLTHRSQNDFIRTAEDEQRFAAYFRTLAAQTGAAAGLACAEAFRKVDDSDLTI